MALGWRLLTDPASPLYEAEGKRIIFGRPAVAGSRLSILEGC